MIFSDPAAHVICPTGCFEKGVSSPARKNISVFQNTNQVYISPVHPTEGRIAIVTDAGWDAMDAAAQSTIGAKADGEVVWFWRPDAGVKSRGCDPAGRRWQKSPVTGKSTKEPVKTIAQETPDCSVNLW